MVVLVGDPPVRHPLKEARSRDAERKATAPSSRRDVHEGAPPPNTTHDANDRVGVFVRVSAVVAFSPGSCTGPCSLRIFHGPLHFLIRPTTRHPPSRSVDSVACGLDCQSIQSHQFLVV